MPTTPQITPAHHKALQAILERRAVKIPLGVLSALKARGWIQLAPNDQPMGTATSYDLTTPGRQALGLHTPSPTQPAANTIGMEAETCEECGGAGQLFVLDETEQSHSCPWCNGSGRILHESNPR
ncbi:MAG: hypothetical protein HQL91_00850 [Magnetococcales bacterium]|nr:hypothetical protein [Magnetococcales bacterium]